MMIEGAWPTAVPSGGFPYYAWYAPTADDSFQEGKKYFFACVTDEAFYLSPPLESMAQRMTESSRLQFEHPDRVFQIGRTIPFREIAEVRCCKSGNYLELVGADGRVTVQIEEMLSQQSRKIFDDIRRRRAPRTPVEQGPLSTAHSLSGPFWIGGGALMLGGCLSWMASDAAAGQPPQGRRSLVGELLHKLGGLLSYPWVASITAVIVGACLMWFIYRWINPVKGDIVRLR
jgi:hypothetical protein